MSLLPCPFEQLKRYWKQVVDYANGLEPGDWTNDVCEALTKHFLNMLKLYNGRLADGNRTDPAWYEFNAAGHIFRTGYEFQLLKWVEGMLLKNCGMPPGAYPIALPPTQSRMARG
jgi:hypothetical protein